MDVQPLIPEMRESFNQKVVRTGHLKTFLVAVHKAAQIAPKKYRV
jgi:hypothetical protein